MRDDEEALVRPEEIDLADPDLYARGDPFALWRRLRANAPVFWQAAQDGGGFWALTRHADALRVYKDPETFSSARGIFLGRNEPRGDPAGGKMLALTDPPRHTRLRRLLNKGFAPRVVRRLEERMRETARSLVAAAVEQGTCEFVETVAARLPLSVICDLMGVPREDWELMYSLTSTAFGTADAAEQSVAHQEILFYYVDLAEQRRRDPRDDLVSTLVTGDVDGVSLTNEEILLNCDNLMVAGTETVRYATAGGMLAFIEHPDQWERLETERGLLETAVEEILRWSSPPLHILRTATSHVEIGGQAILPGQAVTVWTPSVNRDEEAFDAPDDFDVGRASNRHLTLGAGEHFCLGAALARLELRVLFEELLDQVLQVELAGPVQRVRSLITFGVERMPVTLTAPSGPT